MLPPDTAKIAKAVNQNRSLYDPGRKTVGAMYLQAQLENKHEDAIIVGDMGHELVTSLVDDINDAIANFDKKGSPYYLMVHEKKDLQMKKAIARRILYFGYRPWPEDDTVVFWKNPNNQDLRFCWALPHWSEMENILANRDQFDRQMVYQIESWKQYDLGSFGFRYDEDFKWIPLYPVNQPYSIDKKIAQHVPKSDLSSISSSSFSPQP